MVSHANLFLSPHPDDLVYSAFAAITEHGGEGDALVFFNASRFTRWGLLPKNVATMMRTFEERIVLALLRLGSSFLWMDDSSSRGNAIEGREFRSKPVYFHQQLRNLFCPLGIGEHPDHLAVRDLGIEYWVRCRSKPRIWFYEDLPYAAKIPRVDDIVEKCIRRLPNLGGHLEVRYKPLTAGLFRKKLFFSRLYITQNDQTELLRSRGRELGRRCGAPYAEAYVSSDS